MSRDPVEEYYLRVRPVVGQAFAARRLAVWDLGFGYLAAEALARTGLRRQLWLDSGVAGGALCHSLGRGLAGRPRGEALAGHCAAHNTLEHDWQLTTRPSRPAELRQGLADERPHLLLARGDDGAREVASAALDAGVPFVLTFAPASASLGVVHVVWAPDSAVDRDQLLAACDELAAAPQLDLDRADNHLDGLEARSMALSLGTWLLLRASGSDAAASERGRRPDLEEPLILGGRALVLRGDREWPWSVRFARPDAALARAARQAAPRYRAPLALLRRERVLAVGLGTGSLFCAEAGLLFSQLLFIDCKEVTPVNPVRQIYGTAHVGRPKEEALVEILARRLDPDGSWSAEGEGPIRHFRTAERCLSSARLRLSAEDPASMELFRRILDLYRPTLAIVGMGRSHDDNFAATEELRRRAIRHVTPTAFPGVTHFKQILTDGESGPCYDCLQGHLAVDGGGGPTLAPEEREMFYGGSQPATLAETYPSAHSLLRLAGDLALPRAARPVYLLRELAAERCCFVGANRAERTDAGWLYGVDRPFAMVTYGVADVIAETARGRCSCGRSL